MENKRLLQNLSHLGYPLLESKEKFDVNETLAEVVKSNNVRYWEGFPVLLANAAREGSFDYTKVQGFLKNKTNKEQLKELFLLSLALYELNGLKFSRVMQHVKNFNNDDLDMVKTLRRCLMKGHDFELAGRRFSHDRVKKAFERYFTSEAEEVKNVASKQDQLSLEFALSQVFSSKQKDLFKKKLKGEALTKTEREYFSRAVKKKAAALANPELHRLAQQVYQN